MAGQGVEPKFPEQRRRRNVPVRGEWVEIPAENLAPTPPMPAGEWCARTQAAWVAWWADGASTMWGPADLESLRALAELHQELATTSGGKVTLAAEVRRGMDGLGLTQKGKRDFRWRVVESEAGEAGTPTKRKKSRYEHLRAV